MHGTIYFDPVARFLTPPTVLQSAAALAAAQRIATGRYAPRVQRVALPITAVTLMRWDEMRGFAANSTLAWPFLATKADEWARFERTMANQNLTNEGRRERLPHPRVLI